MYEKGIEWSPWNAIVSGWVWAALDDPEIVLATKIEFVRRALKIFRLTVHTWTANSEGALLCAKFITPLPAPSRTRFYCILHLAGRAANRSRSQARTLFLARPDLCTLPQILLPPFPRHHPIADHRRDSRTLQG